jgi:Peptidase family M48
MDRYLIAAALSCLYVAGSIWIVRSEGQAYRNGLAKMKPAVTDADEASPPLIHEMDKPISRDATLEIKPARPEPANSQPAPTPVVESSTKTADEHASRPAPAQELAKAPPAASAPRNNAAPQIAGAAVPVNPLATDSFWSRPQLARDWSVARLSTRDERDLGAALHELIIHFNPLVADPGSWLSRVEDAAEPFRQTLRRKEIKYRFFILDSDVVNAFSAPGGYVYVSRGLFDLIGEDEDYALQFALGHEIAHVDLQHAIKCLLDPGVMTMREGTLQKLYLLILPFGYLESDTVDQEFEADEWVSNRMQRFGRSRREILVFLQKLEGYAKTRGFGEGRIKPDPARDLSPLENHYRAQTAARKRLKHLKAIMDKSADAPK